MARSNSPNFFQPRELSSFDDASGEGKRFLLALKWVKKPYQFSLEEITEKDLTEIIKKINKVPLHYSGNCVPLAMAFVYNCKIGITQIRIGNTAPFYKGLDSDAISKILFGKELDLIKVGTEYEDNQWKMAEERLSSILLANFRQTNERVFCVGCKKHMLNAVVLGKDEDARIVFIDPWYKKIYQEKDFIKKYKKTDLIMIYYHPGLISPLIKPSDSTPLNSRP